MMELKIYGKPSYPYEYLKSMVQQGLETAEIEFELEEKTSFEEFIRNDIQKIPAVQMNGSVFYLDIENSTSSAKTIVNNILKKENFGKMKKIITPIDYSQASENALTYAIRMGKEMGAVNQIVHAYQPTPLDVDNAVYVQLEETKKDKFKKYTEAINDVSLQSKNAQQIIDSSFEIGAAGEVLKDISKGANQLIVMGSSGESKGIKRWFGSVSTEVSKNAQCPVLIVPPALEFKGFKNIAYMCHDLEMDAYALNNLQNTLGDINANIYGVHIAQQKPYDFEILKNTWNQFYNKSKLKFHTILGDSTNAFNTFCEENEIDLVVLQRPQRSFVQKLFHQSFTKKMVLHTKTPLLIMHSNDEQ